MYKYLLTILLFAVSVSAQVYPVDPSRDSIITYCLYETNTPTTFTGNLTEAKAIYFLNKSLGQVCVDFPALEKVDTVVLSTDSMGCALNTDFIRATRIYKIADNKGQILIPLRYVPTDSTWVIYPGKEQNTGTVSNKSTPSSYFTFGKRFYPHPKSLAISTVPDSFIVFYNAMDAKLTTATDSVAIGQDYLGALIDLTVYEFAKLRRQAGNMQAAMDKYLARMKSPKPREAELKR